MLNFLALITVLSQTDGSDPFTDPTNPLSPLNPINQDDTYQKQRKHDRALTLSINWATIFGHLEAVQKIYEEGYFPECKAIREAEAEEHYKIVNYLKSKDEYKKCINQESRITKIYDLLTKQLEFESIKNELEKKGYYDYCSNHNDGSSYPCHGPVYWARHYGDQGLVNRLTENGFHYYRGLK